jgi:hypothetical protein
MDGAGGRPFVAGGAVGGPTAQDMTAINRSRCAIAYRQDARSGTAPFSFGCRVESAMC